MEKAIQIFPDRAEPHYHLGKYLNSIGKHERAFTHLMWARNCSLNEVKSKYILFVNEKCYDIHVNDELSVACYWIGKYQDGIGYLQAIIDLPEFESHKERLITNLKHYQNKLNGN
jgi:tetratricopeptide (TPR) repeat protein